MGTDLPPNLRQDFPASASPPPKLRRRPETKPLCLRFTQEEPARLEAVAGSQPLGTFIRGLVLGTVEKPYRARNLHPVRDREALGRVLGALGQSRLSQNLNQLAKAVHPITTGLDAMSHQRITGGLRVPLRGPEMTVVMDGKRTPTDRYGREALGLLRCPTIAGDRRRTARGPSGAVWTRSYLACQRARRNEDGNPVTAGRIDRRRAMVSAIATDSNLKTSKVGDGFASAARRGEASARRLTGELHLGGHDGHARGGRARGH